MWKGEHFNKKHENRAIKCIRVRDENIHYRTAKDHSNYEKSDNSDNVMSYSLTIKLHISHVFTNLDPQMVLFCVNLLALPLNDLFVKNP